jgi:plasmid stabilization system protein ParE
MQNVPDTPPELSVRWSARAQKTFLDSLDRIFEEDPATARLVLKRVEKSIAILAQQPGIGTFTAMPGVRRYPIPQTGHAIDYRVAHGELRIQRWYRQRQRRDE